MIGVNRRVSNIATSERLDIILVNWDIIAILILFQTWGSRNRWFESSRSDQKLAFATQGFGSSR
ncbi:hypothetical protein I0600191H4_01580 [Collinsella sp. i06-0019-1H4]